MTNSATTTKTTVAIYLDKEPIHVHAADCADTRKYQIKPWLLDASTATEVVTGIYPPAEFDYDACDTSEMADLLAGLKMFPCVSFPSE